MSDEHCECMAPRIAELEAELAAAEAVTRDLLREVEALADEWKAWAAPIEWEGDVANASEISFGQCADELRALVQRSRGKTGQ